MPRYNALARQLVSFELAADAAARQPSSSSAQRKSLAVYATTGHAAASLARFVELAQS